MSRAGRQETHPCRRGPLDAGHWPLAYTLASRVRVCVCTCPQYHSTSVLSMYYFFIFYVRVKNMKCEMNV